MQETKFNLVINAHNTIASIQKDFNNKFKYLKIEFFKKKHERGEASARKNMYESSMQVNLIMERKGPPLFQVSSLMKVHEFEKQFRDLYGLNAQVFRKSGNVWLETSATDSWSLEEQNEEGHSLAQQWKTEKENPDDHDMYG